VKEATARIKINRLLETAGWRFFDDAHGAPNIRLESNATIKQADLDALGNDFERTSKGFIVAEIEAEQALVDANRELVVRMEKKVQATLARIWGEESKPAEGKSREAA
jgi:hypothetical protein